MKRSDPIFIYLLRDPKTDDVRYVGQSFNPFYRRKIHVRYPANNLRDWITALQNENRIPALQIIEETTRLEADFREVFWIEYYAKRGCKLLNTTHMPNPEPRVPKFRRLKQEQRERLKQEQREREQMENYHKHLSAELERNREAKCLGWKSRATYLAAMKRRAIKKEQGESSATIN